MSKIKFDFIIKSKPINYNLRSYTIYIYIQYIYHIYIVYDLRL